MTSSSGKRQTSQERANGSPRWKNRTSSISQQKLLQTKNAETARIQSWLDIKENEVTHIRSRAIMLETCGCPVENPECRFLQDAVEAKKKLPAAETELETYRQQAEERAEQLDAE